MRLKIPDRNCHSVERTTDAADEAWREITSFIATTDVTVTIRTPSPAATTAETLGLSPHTYLGAIARHSAGLTIGSGWLRILGGSSDDGLPGLDEANASATGLLVVAYDVLGGVFALDGGALGVGDGTVHHFSVDTLKWQNLELGYSDFVWAMLGGAADRFYEPLRWAGWENEVARVLPSQGLALYPFPSSVQGQDVAASTKRAVPFTELIDFHNDFARQINGNRSAPAIPFPQPLA